MANDNKSILDTILEAKNKRPEKRRPSLTNLLKTSCEPVIIGEIKRGSPSKGVFAPDLDIEETVKRYENIPVGAFSVLTEVNFFKGGYPDLIKVASLTDKAILCKDFIDSYEQVAKAYTYGASVILLIAKMLPKSELESLITFAHQLKLEVLMEIHNDEEFEKVKDLSFDILGINNRNLNTFVTDTNVSKQLFMRFELDKKTYPVISESGFKNRQTVCDCYDIGLKGALIGESLVKKEFSMLKESEKKLEIIKICGLKNINAIDAACENGATHIGFVLAESKRKVTLQACKELIEYARAKYVTIQIVLVLKNTSNRELNELYQMLSPDIMQVHGEIKANEELAKPIKIWRAVPSDHIDEALILNEAESVEAILIDAPKSGSGQVFEWGILEGFVSKIKKPLIVAGGLNENNVPLLLRKFKISGVDVSSGVETDGEKDNEKIERFLKIVKENA